MIQIEVMPNTIHLILDKESQFWLSQAKTSELLDFWKMKEGVVLNNTKNLRIYKVLKFYKWYLTIVSNKQTNYLRFSRKYIQIEQFMYIQWNFIWSQSLKCNTLNLGLFQEIQSTWMPPYEVNRNQIQSFSKQCI